MKATVLGATGHVGNAVLRELLARGAEVTAVGRRAEPGANLSGLAVPYRSMATEDSAGLAALLKGQDLVVDAAAPYRLESLAGCGGASSVEDDAWERMNGLLNAVRSAGARFAHVSSFATLPARRDALDAVQAKLARAAHPYFKAKRVMEDEVLVAAERGLPAVVVNPTYCLGPWDAKPAETCLVPQVLLGRMPAAVSHGVNVIDVRDVAVGLATAVERERWGEPVLLTGHDLTISSLFARICEAGGARPPALSAPASLAALAATVNDALLSRAGRPTSQAALAALLVLQQGPTSPSRAQRDLGLHPRPLSRTIADAIAWYRAEGYC